METPQTRTGSDGLSMELPCLPAEGTLEQDLCKKKKRERMESLDLIIPVPAAGPSAVQVQGILQIGLLDFCPNPH